MGNEKLDILDAMDQPQPDTFVYDNADLILQITTACGRACEGCYASLGGRRMDKSVAHSLMDELPAGGLVALRGGEPTMYRRWYEDFVIPAMQRRLRVAIDSNGWFIDSPHSEGIVEKLSDPSIFVRISFDEAHLRALKPEKRAEEFVKMAKFTERAQGLGMNLRFPSLGMGNDAIDKMLLGTALEIYRKLFYPLTFYSDISEVPIRGKYVAVDGRVTDRIRG